MIRLNNPALSDYRNRQKSERPEPANSREEIKIRTTVQATYQ